MREFTISDRLCREQMPLNWSDGSSELMVGACREMAVFHASNCSDIQKLYSIKGFAPESLKTEADIARIPPIGVTAMKYFLLLSKPESEACLKLTSSGTRGQKTQIWFDQQSLDRVQSQLSTLWAQEALVSELQTNYMMMVYDPEEAKDLGIAFTLKNQQRFAPAKNTWFAIRKDNRGNWQFKVNEVVDHLKVYITEGFPVRIMGIISFIYELLEVLEQSEPLKLPPESRLLTGGGWKTADEKRVPRDYFRQKASKLLGIPEENIRDGYGMAEHSAPYIECRKHRFHVPIYNRIIVRNPETMEVEHPGSPGLLELITPFNAMMPNLAILSTDVGFIDPDPCPCGLNSPTFTLVGRGGITKHKGCAIKAGEIIRRKA